MATISLRASGENGAVCANRCDDDDSEGSRLIWSRANTRPNTRRGD